MRIPIFSILFLFALQLRSQCVPRLDGIYKRIIIIYSVGQYSSQLSEKNTGEFFLTIDTTTHKPIFFGKHINGNYSASGRYNSRTNLYEFMLLNEMDGTQYELGANYRWKFNTVIAADSFIFFDNYTHSKIFTFNNKLLKEIATEANVVGYDDDNIYFTSYFKMRVDGEKYFSGSIFRLNEHGYKCIHQSKRSSEYFNRDIIFYSPKFNVETNYMFTEEIDCIRNHHFKSTVQYENTTIDTFYYFNNDLNPARVHYYNDTLTIINQREEKKYTKSGLISRLNIFDSLSIQPELKNHWFSYEESEEFFMVTVNKYHAVTDTSQTVLPIYTNNGILLPNIEGSYDEIYLFGKTRYNFLGYPKIIYTND